MKSFDRSRPLAWMLSTFALLGAEACGSSTATDGLASSSRSGGATAQSGGAGGVGTPLAGGSSAGGSAPGGTRASGGVTASTGGQASGGTTNRGGTTASGGTQVLTGGTSSGGRAAGGSASGGTLAGGRASGGSNTGGTGAAGASTGGKATGGRASGGTLAGGSSSGGRATGGVATGGAATGGSATGGTPAATACTLTGSPSSGSGSFTYYWFGQGTGQENGKYITACGYQGTESGQVDTVANIVNANYFAAIPGNASFDTVTHCGECVQIGNNGKTIVATIIDECPTATNPACTSGHLDLSYQAWADLGYSVGNPSGTTWQFVPCQVTGNVVFRMKSGNQNEFFIEHVVTPIASVTWNGTAATRTSYGAWHFGSNLTSGAQLVLKDMAGRTITITVTDLTQNVNQDTRVQFPKCQ